MEVYYTKKEYKEMENRLKKQLKTAEAKIERLEAKVKKLQKDYDVLLETATEEVEDNKEVAEETEE
jgi:archaellum component FlaC